jgi:hypothetical protein
MTATSLPAGIERQMLDEGRDHLPPPLYGEPVLVWTGGGVFEGRCAGRDGSLMRFVHGGRCYAVPAERVTRLGVAS